MSNRKQYKNFIVLSRESLKEKNNNRIEQNPSEGSIFTDFTSYKKFAEAFQLKKLNHLNTHLNNFENQANKKNIKVLWAVNHQDALDELKKVVKSHSVSSLWHSSGYLFDEIGLRFFLDDTNISVSNQDDADILLYQANGITEEFGGIYLEFEKKATLKGVTENKPKVFLVSIEKVFSNTQEIELYRSVYSKTQLQSLPTYSLMYSPSKELAEPVYVLIIDNRRTEILRHPEIRQALSCIHCKACLQVCPIYQKIGDVPYDNVFTGPISSVILPYLEDKDNYNFLSFACTLCGNCEKHCPMGIPITRLILENRHRFSHEKKGVKQQLKQSSLFYFFSNRKKMNTSTIRKNIKLRTILSRDFKKNREIIDIKNQSFNQIWIEKQKKNDKSTGFE